jgi:IcmF-related N-terminal domain
MNPVTLLSMCLSPVRELAAIAYPWRDDGKRSAALRWGLHLLLGSALLAGLWYLNRWGGLERVLRSPWPALHRTWLPLLGLLTYLLGWLSRGLWLSLQRDPLPSVWPDLNIAWQEARVGLKQANIDVETTPLFLILGPLTPDLRALLQAVGAAGVSQRAELPLHVFAHRPAVFVVSDSQAQLGRPSPDANARAARLNHLCDLLARDRGTRLPIQGIVLAVPFAAVQSMTATRKVVAETQDDLRAVRQATGLEVPLYLAISGLDLRIADAKGEAAWFMRFPPLPDLDPAEVHRMFQDGVDRLCLEQIAGEVRSHFQVEADGRPAEALRENIRLYRWLAAIHAWRVNLGRLLVEGTRNEYSEPGMVAGCYVLPSGTAKSALAHALSVDLLAYQHTACWTAEARAAHARQRRRTWLGYGVGLLGLAASLAAVACACYFRA